MGHCRTGVLLVDGDDYLQLGGDDWGPFGRRIRQVWKVEYDNVLQLQLPNWLFILALGLHASSYDWTVFPWPFDGRVLRLLPQVCQRNLTRRTTRPHRCNEPNHLHLWHFPPLSLRHVLRLRTARPRLHLHQTHLGLSDNFLRRADNTYADTFQGGFSH